MASFPSQKRSYAYKMDPKNKFGESCIDALIDRSTFGTQDATTIQALYDAYNGIIHTSEYEYLTNPLHSEKLKKKRYPAHLRNINIIKPVVDMYVAEMSKRPMKIQVTCINPDIINRKKEAEMKTIESNLQQQFINTLNEQGYPTGMPSEPIETPTQAKQTFDTNYNDTRAIEGQHALNYIEQNLDIRDKMQTGVFDWIVSGQVCSYKGVVRDDIEYEIISPLELSFQKSPGIRYIEDGDWAVRRCRMSTSAVVDKFYDMLDDEQIDGLEINQDLGTNVAARVLTENTESTTNNGSTTENLHDVYHAVWKSLVKIGLLTYLDEFGQLQEMEVSEEYKLNKDAGDINIEWYWVNQVWEGYKIDKYYVGIGPIKGQRNLINNLSACKLPYNGRTYSDRHSSPISVVSPGLEIQALINALHFKLELSIIRNKDKIALIDRNAIPKKDGWDEETFMYYADAMQFAFIDPTAENSQGEKSNFAYYQVLDMSLGQYIEKQFNIIQAIKQEWKDMNGINRQREGNMLTSDGQGVTERAVYQSSIMSEEMYRRFEAFELMEYKGLLDLSKHAWRNGLKASYLNSDVRQVMFEVDPDEYQDSEFGLFPLHSPAENDKLNTMKSLVQNFAMNGGAPELVADILDASNFAQLKVRLHEYAKQSQEAQQELEIRQQEAQAAIKQYEAEREEDKQAHESDEKQKDRDHDYNMKILDLESQNATAPEGAQIDVESIQKNYIERDKAAETKRANMAQESLKKEELRIKQHATDVQLQIARENKNKFDSKSKSKK